ncbi:MAG: hypothetical protein JXA71_13240 [Chitinispirillaceae bacterium]|nr:hypothetical protein [Chitinispirillaceae bacterium]
MSYNTPKGIARNRIIAVSTLTVITGLMYMVAFRPFVFSPRNGVRPLPDASGVAMHEGIIMGSDTLSRSDQGLFSRRAITIELLITPVVRDIGKKQQLLGFYDPRNRRSLRITQWRRYFIVESLRDNRWREIAFPLQCESLTAQCITVASDPTRTVLYANGTVMAEMRYGIIRKSTIPSGRLLLGNNEHAQSPWSGHLHGCAIYAGCLSDSAVLAGSGKWLRRTAATDSLPLPLMRYSFSAGTGKVLNLAADRYHLEIPERLIVLKRLFLVPPWKDLRVSFYYFRAC